MNTEELELLAAILERGRTERVDYELMSLSCAHRPSQSVNVNFYIHTDPASPEFSVPGTLVDYFKAEIITYDGNTKGLASYPPKFNEIRLDTDPLPDESQAQAMGIYFVNSARPDVSSLRTLISMHRGLTRSFLYVVTWAYHTQDAASNPGELARLLNTQQLPNAPMHCIVIGPSQVTHATHETLRRQEMLKGYYALTCVHVRRLELFVEGGRPQLQLNRADRNRYIPGGSTVFLHHVVQ